MPTISPVVTLVLGVIALAIIIGATVVLFKKYLRTRK